MNAQKQTSWTVFKFGGTSMGSAEAINKVLNIIENYTEGRLAVVVSAMSGVTDRLIQLAQKASHQNSVYQEELESLYRDHYKTALELFGSEIKASSYCESVLSDIKDLKEILRGVWLSKHLPESILELVSGYGEIWSSKLLTDIWREKKSKQHSDIHSTHQENVHWMDARKILLVESGETGPLLQWSECQNNWDEYCSAAKEGPIVITGFIASTPKGVPTTLKRNGSDFSASIFGRLSKSKEIVIWTDVDGVYSADPRKVPEAECLKEISYEEAIELAYFGAKVIHPHTMGPAVELNIPILIKNTFNPSAPGTYIHRILNHSDGRVARGFTTVDNVSLINVEGTGMIGVPGVSQRLFGALKEVKVSVILISQASSEHSICFVVPSDQAEMAKAAALNVFQTEVQHNIIEKIQIIPNQSILAMVGDNMVEKSGVAGRFFSALGMAGVSVRAIAQGSSERNISAVIDQSNATKALRATHSAFFLSDTTLSIGLIGPGIIGQTTLKQLSERKEWLQKKYKVDLRVRAIANSSKMSLELKEFQSQEQMLMWLNNSQALDYNLFQSHVKSEGIPHSVILDCTASDEMASLYPQWMESGIHIITPNKKAGSGSMERYQKIQSLQEDGKSLFYYEATVGAGLPIITTLRDLVQTGDEIISIEGIISGTLSYIFSKFSQSVPFSHIVLSAKQMGFTEPDPRDDLNGMDVARKLVILAREAGMLLSLDSVPTESLVSEELKSIKSTDEFMSRLPELDSLMEQKRARAESQNKVLRYTGVLNADGTARVGLNEYSKDHPFARVKGTDNILSFKTKRYNQQPLFIQGPGAGPEVTASAIFADLLRLTRTLGAHS